MKAKTIYLLLALAAAGCVTPTPYQAHDRGQGYQDQRIEANRYRIHFAGNSRTSRQTVETYLLYRAAEVTLANGYDYFVAAQRSTEADTRYEQTATGGFGYYGFGYYWVPRAALTTSTSYPVTEFDAQADIVMFKGTKPANDAQAFDARDVKNNLEASIIRPQPKS